MLISVLFTAPNGYLSAIAGRAKSRLPIITQKIKSLGKPIFKKDPQKLLQKLKTKLALESIIGIENAINSSEIAFILNIAESLTSEFSKLKIK